MAIHARVAAAVAAGLIFASFAAIGDDATPQPKKHSAAAENPRCLTHTGSLMSAKGKCSGTGRSYTRDDIDRTGKTTLGGALAELDPSITVHR
jgi:hypothetical protein